MFSCRVRSSTALGGGGSSLPHGPDNADPGTCFFSLLSGRPQDHGFGETTRMVSCPWWRMLMGGLFGGVKASSLRCSYAVNRPRVEDRVFREKSLSARLTPTRCRLWVASPLPEGRRGYPSSASLCVPGETLGPVRWSGQQRCFLKVLLGTRRFGDRSVVVLLRRA